MGIISSYQEQRIGLRKHDIPLERRKTDGKNGKLVGNADVRATL